MLFFRGRSMTMTNSEPVISALLEDFRALWSIFLGSSNAVHVRRECCLELGKSWCGTILPILETNMLPRLQASLRQEGVQWSYWPLYSHMKIQRGLSVNVSFSPMYVSLHTAFPVCSTEHPPRIPIFTFHQIPCLNQCWSQSQILNSAWKLELLIS